MRRDHGIRARATARGQLLAAVVLALVCGMAVTQPLRADAAGDLEAVLSAGDYQRELPGKPEIKPPPPDWLSWLSDLDFSGWSFIGYIVLGAMAVMLIVFLARRLSDPIQDLWYRARGRKRRRVMDEPGPELQAISATEEGTALERADALARAGRFAEAVRVLLLACIGTVREFAPAAAEDSLTSREVLLAAPLQRGAREAFGVLVAAEEAGRFAERALDQTSYGAARTNFGVFAEASREGAA